MRVTGLEVVAALAAGYLWRKWRRVSGRADAEVDAVLDAGMDRLHRVVAARLGTDSAVVRLEQEARSGLEQNPRTLERVRLAIEDAADDDPGFREVLERLVAELQSAEKAGGVSAGDGGLAVGGDIHIAAEGGSVAGGVVNVEGGVSLGNPRVPGPDQA